MPTDRAIDKLKKAFSISNKSSYPIYKNGELILKVYWSPLTIADRDTINATFDRDWETAFVANAKCFF